MRRNGRGFISDRSLRAWLCLLLACGLAVTLRAQADGALRWAFTTLSTATAGTITSSPALGPDGTVYVGVAIGTASSAAPGGRLFALDPSGAKKWEFVAPDWIEATPAVAPDGTIYVGCWNGVLYALRPDGTKRWETKLAAFIASSAAIGPDGTIYVGAGSDLIAVSPEGGLKWTFPAGDWVDSSPAVGADGTVYFGSWDGNVYALRPDGTEKWRYGTEGNVTSSPALAADGRVIVGSRDLHVYALTRHGSLAWKFMVGDPVEASPVIGADGTIYVASSGGRVHALQANGVERWRFPRAGSPALRALVSTPAVRADGSIVFGSNDNALFAVRADGTELWRAPLGDFADSSPVVGAGTIYVGAADKKIYAIACTAGPVATEWPEFRRSATRHGWLPMGHVSGTAGRVVNLSVRTVAGVGADTLIVGFVVAGEGERSLLVRGVGPTLTQFGVPGVLADPGLTVYAGGARLADNDDWGTAANAATVMSVSASVGAFALPEASRDAALLRNFSAGGYTVHVGGSSTGVALMEAYDAGGAAGARLGNVSARSRVEGGAGVLIAGFTIKGSARAVLIRGVGPTLAGFGVSGTLQNPHLRVFQGAQLLAENDDWRDGATAGAGAGAFALPSGSADATLLLTLPPGSYTAQVSGVAGGSGVGLIEVYELP